MIILDPKEKKAKVDKLNFALEVHSEAGIPAARARVEMSLRFIDGLEDADFDLIPRGNASHIYDVVGREAA